MREDDSVLNEAAGAVLAGSVERAAYQRLWRRVMAVREPDALAGPSGPRQCPCGSDLTPEGVQAVPAGACTGYDQHQAWMVSEGLSKVAKPEPVRITLDALPEDPERATREIGWRSPCVSYSEHRSQHVIRDGFAVCTICDDVAATPSVLVTITITADEDWAPAPLAAPRRRAVSFPQY